MSDEELVLGVMRGAISAGNKKDVGGVVEHAVDEFKGPRGADLSECRRVLLGYFMQQGWFHAFERDLSVKVEGTNATAVADLIIAGGTQREVKTIEDLLPNEGGRYVFTVKLSKIDGKWKFVSAEYERRAI